MEFMKHPAKLAIEGGPQTKTTPYGSGKRFGDEELRELAEALEQETLFYHLGSKVKQFMSDFSQLYGVAYSVAVSSGTAAIHTALGAAGVTVGDEVITSPITDQGSVIGILYQNAIPVFADIDPHTYNMDPAAVERCVTPRTKAIVAVHLAGNPCEMDAIMRIARAYKLTVIEDCAQSYMAYYKGRLVGTIGDYGCFSTNDFKHVSTGEGGIVTINSGDETDYRRVHAFADKNYSRFGSGIERSPHYLAPNYRMTELQGAVGIAQLRKLPAICAARNRLGDALGAGLTGMAGIHPHRITHDSRSSYWFYLLRLDRTRLRCTRNAFSKALEAEGILNGAGYIPFPIYMQPMFQQRQAYRHTHFPFELTGIAYASGLCPVSEQVLADSIFIRISEFYTDQDIKDIVAGIGKVAAFHDVGGKQ